MKKLYKNIIVVASLLVFVFVCMSFANAIQRDFNKVDVTTESFLLNEKEMTYKLYKPKTASESSKAPAVLLLHGYQNDKETNAAYAIELSRRGYVVLSLDEYGHGATEISLKERGYVNHKVTVNYGVEDENEFVEVNSNLIRYRVMMNFSNLSFFNDKYVTDDKGNTLKDSAMGGVEAYAYLAGLPYVDNTKMGISGHSMGTWASWSVAAMTSGMTLGGVDITPKATVLQCGELFSKAAYSEHPEIKFNNVLLLNAKWDEFNYFRDYADIVSDDLMDTPLRKEFLGITEKGEWNTTYGSFADGSARRIELLKTNHRLTTHNKKGLAVALEWFDNATNHTSTIPYTNITAKAKEYLVFVSLLAAIAMFIPLVNILLEVPFFKSVMVGVPNRDYRIKTKKKWWIGATITMLTATVTYPFMTQLGHGLLPLPEGIFRMTIGNGFLCWYTLLIIVMLITTIIPYHKSKKTEQPLDFYDLGLASEETSKRIDFKLMGKSILLTLAILLVFYGIIALTEAIFQLDLRFIWPFFKTFNFERFLQFLVYIPVFALFFILNNSKIFAGMRVKETSEPGLKAFLSCWWRYALLMIGGVMIIVLLEYIPFFLDLGPGADLIFSPTFGGPFMSLLIVFVPQVIVFSVLCTYMYRKTGNIYVGAFLVSIMACWIVTGGSAIL